MKLILSATALLTALCVVVPTPTSAQSTNSGDIRGTVTDNSGAAIPGATVTLTDVDKAVTKTLTTDGAGLYDTGAIVPDHYTLTFTKSGFQTLIRGPITVEVGVQGVNAQLQVGAQSVEVTVNTDVPLLETESGSQERTLTAQTMAQLPQVGADWENFIWLQPGAAGTPQNSSSAVQPNAGQVAINGNLPFESVLADGATTTLPMSQNSDVTIFEATGEVKISSSGFGAQYGIGNIIYNQISKGGTDRFHGSAYEYFQNDALNALPYAFGTHPKKGPLRYNNFGFNVGGPIIPHRMFFFFDFDKTINNGGSSIGFQTVPTTAFQNGTFNAGIPDLYDPTTQTIQQSGSHTYVTPAGSFSQTCPCVIRKTFASEYGSNAIPAALIDKVSAAVQKYYPAPNVSNPTVSSGIAQNNYTYNTPNQNPFTKYFGRLDWDITHNNRLTLSETSSDNPATFLNQQICPINCQHGDVSRDNAQVTDVWIINSNLTNEARMGFTDQMNYFTPFSIGQGYPSKLNWQFAQADTFPDVAVSNFYELQPASNAVYKEMVFDPSDVVSWVHGRHILHFGGEFLIMRADSTAWGNLNAGKMNYNGNFTSINGQNSATLTNGATYSSGLGYADFLLGQTQGWSASVTPEFGARQKGPQVFVQDDIKLTPHLTINAGLRWEANTGWSEVKGNEAVYDPTVINPANNSLGAMWYGTTKANGRTQLIAPQWNIWLPRVGFAWQTMPNTVLRGAFGMYASMLSEDTYGAGMGGALGSRGTVNDSTSGLCPVVQFSGTGTTPDTTDPGCGTGQFNGSSILSKYIAASTAPDAQNNPGGNVSYNQYHTPIPTNYQWTLSFERQLGANYAFYLAYVGNHGTNLNFPVDINQVPENHLGPNNLNFKAQNPLFGIINGSTNNAISNYHALEADVRKRLSYNLEFDVNYTWSHFLDDLDSSGWGSREGYQNYQNAFDPGQNYSNANFDVRNMFKGQAIYTLPFGRRQKFLNNNWALDELVGGWRFSSTWVVQSGSPFGITTGNNNNSNNQSGSYTQYANLVGNPYLSGSVKSRLNEYYNLAAFAVPAQYTYGNFIRNIITGPGIGVMNASLGKTFDLWPDRGVRFELRADSFNVLNHASFGNPGNNAIGNGQSAQITGTTIGGRQIQLYGKVTF
ncbi:MAG TPA: carboxypeptidase-like regulatory domain-containing protein [Acidobacteriaceae bacterium]|nr:carboxypeptidase-like regulatory domain-containing protein [Acidobacteriaceae bacterium]